MDKELKGRGICSSSLSIPKVIVLIYPFLSLGWVDLKFSLTNSFGEGGGGVMGRRISSGGQIRSVIPTKECTFFFAFVF